MTTVWWSSMFAGVVGVVGLDVMATLVSMLRPLDSDQHRPVL